MINNSNRPLHLQFEDEFNKMLEEVFTRKIEENDDFADKYSNLKLSLLTKDIKYFTSTVGQFNGPEQADLELGYEDSSPKFAPLASIEEMYSLGKSPSEIVELVKVDFRFIKLSSFMNKITPNSSKLFPQMTKSRFRIFSTEMATAKYSTDSTKVKETLKGYSLVLLVFPQMRCTELELKKLGLSLGVTGKCLKLFPKGPSKCNGDPDRLC